METQSVTAAVLYHRAGVTADPIPLNFDPGGTIMTASRFVPGEPIH